MKKARILAVSFVLILTGAVFAWTNTGATANETCSTGKKGDCCKPNAACCKDGSCPMCKMKK